MEDRKIYEDIALRTDGDIYLGVVGPVRTGKSTFIKRFMETLVLPNIENVYLRERAKDELPQSGSGRTIMTAEPKFVPEEAVTVSLEGGAAFSVRLVDCVGYMVPGAMGQTEEGRERMVTTPWFDHEISMSQAAEYGTRKVIAEHSTIGVVVTTDGTVTDLPRDAYVESEERTVRELQEIGKPFVLLLNTAEPHGSAAKELAESLTGKYGVSCLAVNCLTLDGEDVANILRTVLDEFPVSCLGVYLPGWVDALPFEHPIKSKLLEQIRDSFSACVHIKDVAKAVESVAEAENVCRAGVREISLGTGEAKISIELPQSLFYNTLSQRSGFDIRDDGDLMALLSDLAGTKEKYERIAEALDDVYKKGYGIVLPGKDELKLEEPEIVRHGGRYGVRLKASAPSIHMVMANIQTEVSPVVDGTRQSEDLINYVLQEFEGDASKIWESNMFGKSLYDIANESLSAKIKRMPEDAQAKFQETLQRIINEGSGGLICIIL